MLVELLRNETFMNNGEHFENFDFVGQKIVLHWFNIEAIEKKTVSIGLKKIERLTKKNLKQEAQRPKRCHLLLGVDGPLI